MEFGSRVKINDDLVVCDDDTYDVAESMLEYAGKETFVIDATDFGVQVDIDGGTFWWHYNVIEELPD